MKILRIALLIGLVLFILSSCINNKRNTNKLQSLNSNVVNLDSLITENLQKNLVDILPSRIANTEIVKLETNRKSLIGSIDKVLLNDKYIVIFDRKRANKVILFNKNGNYITTIGNRGKGIGEHLKIRDISVCFKHENVYIYDDNLKKICVYSFDNKLLEEIKIKFYAQSFIATEEGYIFNTNRRQNKGKHNKNIIITDKKGTILRSIYPLTGFDKITKTYLPGGGIFSNASHPNTGYFAITFQPNILKITDDTTTVFKTITWGKRNLMDQIEFESNSFNIDNILRRSRTLDAVTCYHNIFVTKNHTIFTLQNGSRPTFIINNNSGEIVGGFTRSDYDRLMRKGCFTGTEIVGVFGDTFVSKIRPSQVHRIRDYCINSAKMERDKSEKYLELKDKVDIFFGETNANDNPYLVKFTIR